MNPKAGLTFLKLSTTIATGWHTHCVVAIHVIAIPRSCRAQSVVNDNRHSNNNRWPISAVDAAWHVSAAAISLYFEGRARRHLGCGGTGSWPNRTCPRLNVPSDRSPRATLDHEDRVIALGPYGEDESRPFLWQERNVILSRLEFSYYFTNYYYFFVIHEFRGCLNAWQ